MPAGGTSSDAHGREPIVRARPTKLTWATKVFQHQPRGILKQGRLGTLATTVTYMTGGVQKLTLVSDSRRCLRRNEMVVVAGIGKKAGLLSANVRLVAIAATSTRAAWPLQYATVAGGGRGSEMFLRNLGPI